MEEVLSAWGCLTETASDGATALTALREAVSSNRSFSLVVLDAQMPEMNGLEVERAIRGSADYGHPEVVLLSSLDSRGEDWATLGLSVRTVCLTKPIRQSALLDALVGIFADAHRDLEEVPAFWCRGVYGN